MNFLIKKINSYMPSYISINITVLATISYIYMLLPMFIFFAGWLKPVLGILSIGSMSIALYFLIKKNYVKDEKFELPLWGFFLLVFLLFFWVLFSGVGGFYPQKADWQWRNSLLRDMIQYSWPIRYEKTHYALVYYFNYFLPSAICGKLFGWRAANIFLIFYTWLGVVLANLLICRLLKINTVSKMIILVLIFVSWGGLESIKYDIYNFIGISDLGYQYSSNETLLQWVTNQTIIPWIAVPLFLHKKNLSTYIFLGMCVLACAPLPFIGMFILLSLYGIFQLIKEYYCKFTLWIKDILSFPNVVATIICGIVFGTFYSCNTAADPSTGGIGLYIGMKDFTFQHLVSLLLFLCFNFLVYTIILFKYKKNDVIFWIVNFSLVICPIFRVGAGRDFCMRGSIPALFILMIFVVEYLFDVEFKYNIVKKLLLVGFFAVFINQQFGDFLVRTKVKCQSLDGNENTKLVADDLFTLSNKINGVCYLGSTLDNFLYDYDENRKSLFWDVLSRQKTEKQIVRDNEICDNILSDKKFDLISGEYLMSPILNANMFAQEENNHHFVVNTSEKSIKISDTTTDGKYEIYTENSCLVKVPEDILDGNSEVIIDNPEQAWGDSYISERELVSIENVRSAWKIKWNDQYALAYHNGAVKWELINDSDNQLWNIKRKS